MTENSSSPLEITCSRHFLPWLYEQQVSLAFTTYQTNRLFLVGLKPNGELSTFERLFDRPMGLYATTERLYMSSRYQLWQFDNALPQDELYGVGDNGYDKLYIPRVGYTTGDLDIHDIAPDKTGTIVFVNTLYSCLATLSDRYSFKPLWQPPFISKLAPEDRCHLNGLAMVDGEPGYVTAVSQSDVSAGWRDRRQDGGCVVHAPSNQVVLAGLSMPHSPRFYQGRLWVLNSGTGEFGYVNLEQGLFEAVAFCPGYLRGLTFYKQWAIVGLSKPRDNRTFSGLALDDRLVSKDTEARCGLMIIDLRSGDILHWLHLEGVVNELYDIQVLPGARRPMALGFKTDEIQQIITIDKSPPDILGGPGGRVPLISSCASPKFETRPSSTSAEKKAIYRYQLSLDMSLSAISNTYRMLTFPKIQRKSFHEPLIAVMASYQEKLIGLALAEIRPNGNSGEIISLFVVPDHRQKGVGTRLVTYLEKTLQNKGCVYVDLVYQTNWSNRTALEQMLKKQGWASPRPRMLMCKSTTARLAQSPWLKQYCLPDDFYIFPWSELTSAERQSIQQRQAVSPWYPPVLTPFQEEDKLEWLNSLGVRHRVQVIGWMITHRVAPDTIQYTSLFIQPEFQGLGRGIALLGESIQRQIASDAPNSICLVDVENKSMVRFVNRHLRPYLVSSSELWASRKFLSP